MDTPVCVSVCTLHSAGAHALACVWVPARGWISLCVSVCTECLHSRGRWTASRAGPDPWALSVPPRGARFSPGGCAVPAPPQQQAGPWGGGGAEDAEHLLRGHGERSRGQCHAAQKAQLRAQHTQWPVRHSPTEQASTDGAPSAPMCRAQQTPAWLQPGRSPGPAACPAFPLLPGPTGPWGEGGQVWPPNRDTGSGCSFLGLWAQRRMEGRAGRHPPGPAGLGLCQLMLK